MLNRIYKETEKAIQTEMVFVNLTTDAEFTRKVWVPKSQLSANGIPGEWITSQKIQELVGQDRWKFCCYWEREDGTYTDFEYTDKELAAEERRQAAMQAGLEALNGLIEYGKAHGVKGLRKGLKKSTVLRKIREAGVEVPAAV